MRGPLIRYLGGPRFCPEARVVLTERAVSSQRPDCFVPGVRTTAVIGTAREYVFGEPGREGLGVLGRRLPEAQERVDLAYGGV
jgi:hypothetical protein